MPEQPAPLLTVAELADLRAAVLYGYEGGRPPTDLPPRIATYAYEPDGGLIDVIDLATRYAARVAELEAALDESRGDAGRAHGQAWALLARTVELRAQVIARDARVAELEAQLDRVRAVHEPIDAVNMRHHPRGQLAYVCSGCGTDDGNWQTYPCPTIRGLDLPGDGPARPRTAGGGR